MAMRAALVLALLLAAAGGASAQGSRDAERKLQQAKRELQAVAAERRKIEGERGEEARRLRAADERVGRSARTLRELEQRLDAERAQLAQLQQRRAALGTDLDRRRAELSALLRAAYAQGGDAPLKALLAQDRSADARRVREYHRRLQHARAARIAALSAELRAIDALEASIAGRQAELDALRAKQRVQLQALQRDREARAAVMARLERDVRDRQVREKALGRDVQGLETLLRRLRAAAARAERERRAAAQRDKAAAGPGASRPPAATPRAAASGPQVGGAGWPVAGALLAGYRATMPDGRPSDGFLIGAGAGTPVKAVADGTVVYAEWMTGYGLLTIVDHGNGYMSLYAHNEALLREAGAAVRRGESIATVGSSGGHGRAALYFELRRNGRPVDPATWLRR